MSEPATLAHMPNLNEPPVADERAQSTGLNIKLGFFPLAFFLYACRPRVEINGQVHVTAWGQQHFSLPPGRHELRVYFVYLWWRRCGENRLPLQLAPGQKARVRYFMWPWVFMPGNLTNEDAR